MQIFKTIAANIATFINKTTPELTDSTVFIGKTVKHSAGGLAEISQTFHLDSAIDGIKSRKDLMKECGISATSASAEDKADYAHLMSIVNANRVIPAADPKPTVTKKKSK